jgi:hypothetical protein
MTARALTPEAILEVLTSHEPLRKLARKHNTHVYTIQKARAGLSYREYFPEIPRPGIAAPGQSGLTCDSCIHHHERGHCTLELPEGRNVNFARLCSAYAAKEGGET